MTRPAADLGARVLGTVEAVHQPTEAHSATGPHRTVCTHCATDDPCWPHVPWPCPTVSAARAALAGHPVPVHVHGGPYAERPWRRTPEWAPSAQARALFERVLG